jgi:hypothetical protein
VAAKKLDDVVAAVVLPNVQPLPMATAAGPGRGRGHCRWCFLRAKRPGTSDQVHSLVRTSSLQRRDLGLRRRLALATNPRWFWRRTKSGAELAQWGRPWCCYRAPLG